jgi:hypothetical protein
MSGSNVEEQFGKIRCQQAMYSPRAAPRKRRAHAIDSYELFVDLVKVYDTVKHALLFGIMKKCGILEEIFEVAERI